MKGVLIGNRVKSQRPTTTTRRPNLFFYSDSVRGRSSWRGGPREEDTIWLAKRRKPCRESVTAGRRHSTVAELRLGPYSVIGLSRIRASEETETEILIPRPGPTPCEALHSHIRLFSVTGIRWARPCTGSERRPAARKIQGRKGSAAGGGGSGPTQ